MISKYLGFLAVGGSHITNSKLPKKKSIYIDSAHGPSSLPARAGWTCADTKSTVPGRALCIIGRGNAIVADFSPDESFRCHRGLTSKPAN